MYVKKLNPLFLSKNLHLLIVIFSPIFAIKLIKFSFTNWPLDILVLFRTFIFPFDKKLSSDNSLQKV